MHYCPRICIYIKRVKQSDSLNLYCSHIIYMALGMTFKNICPQVTGKPWSVMSPEAVIYLIDSQAMTSQKYIVSSQSFLHTEIYTFDYFNTVIFFVIVKNVSEVDLQPPYLLIYYIFKVQKTIPALYNHHLQGPLLLISATSSQYSCKIGKWFRESLIWLTGNMKKTFLFVRFRDCYHSPSVGLPLWYENSIIDGRPVSLKVNLITIS